MSKMETHQVSPTPTLPLTRIMLYVSAVLVLAISFFLFLFPTRTDTLFAWTINPPLTAAFLGAGFLASAPLTYLSAKEGLWARARIAVPGVLLFTILTTIATFIHLDRFHLDSPNLFTRFVTWVWIIVYILDPLLLGVALIMQMRLPRVDPPRKALLPSWYRLLLGVLGLPMFLLGILMFISPESIIPIWPWELTPLTSRAVGAWLVGIGFVLLQAIWENDWTRLRGMVIATGILGVLQLLNLARFPGTLAWSRLSGILYIVYCVGLMLAGGYGWWQTRRYAAGAVGE
jgi:hypothetical protein